MAAVRPQRNGLDLLIGDPTPGAKDIARRLYIQGGSFQVGAPVTLDDFAGCPVAATANRLGAECGETILYDDAFAPFTQVQAAPPTAARTSGVTFDATPATFQLAWANDDASVGFASVDESGAVAMVPSPFGAGLYSSALVLATSCGQVIRGAVELNGTLDVALAAGVVAVSSMSAHGSQGFAEWPFARDAVAYTWLDSDVTHEVLEVVDEGGERAVAQFPTDGTFVSQLVPMPWGLALIRPQVTSINPPQAATLDVVVVDAYGNVTATLTLPPIESVVGGFGWARTGDTLVIGWGEPTGTYATAIGCD